MKILIITERFYPEDFIINSLAEHWAALGHKITVMTQVPSYPQGKVASSYVNLPFQTERWGKITIKRFFTVTGYRESLAKKLLNYVSFAVTGTLCGLPLVYAADRVFVYQTGPLTQAMPAAVWARVFKKPVVIWTQDVWPDSVYAYGFKKTKILALFLDTLIRFIYKPCGRVLTSCRGFAERLKPYTGKAKLVYAPNWSLADFSGGNPAPAGFQRGFNFTFAGNIGKMQNLDMLIKAFAEAEKQNTHIFFNIVGDGSFLPELKTLAAELKAANVVFHGRRPVEAMKDIFAASDCLVLSLKDSPIFELTVPSKFQAYLTAGKPLLCAMKGETAAMAKESGAGFCADPADTSAITDLFLRIAAPPPEHNRALGAKARAYYELNFSFTAAARRVTEAVTGPLP